VWNTGNQLFPTSKLEILKLRLGQGIDVNAKSEIVGFAVEACRRCEPLLELLIE
jgi:hypothetical protein